MSSFRNRYETIKEDFRLFLFKLKRKIIRVPASVVSGSGDISNEKVAGAVAAANLAASKAGFASLNLDANYISDEGVEEVKSVMEGAGISGALMPMEENDYDMADEPEDDQAAALDAMLANLKM